MKALVGTFNQEKALVGAFSVIVQPVVEPMDRFTALSLGDPSSKTPVSPRCSIGDKIDKLSPVSSGFCSGEEGELSPVLAPDLSPISQCQNSPIYEEPAPETVS